MSCLIYGESAFPEVFIHFLLGNCDRFVTKLFFFCQPYHNIFNPVSNPLRMLDDGLAVDLAFKTGNFKNDRS